MKTFYTYILLCDQKTFYVGVTWSLDKRLFEHRNKLSFHTKQFSDIKLVYFEKYHTLVEARRREKQFKGWSHVKKAKYIEVNKSAISTELAEVLQGREVYPERSRRESLSGNIYYFSKNLFILRKYR